MKIYRAELTDASHGIKNLQIPLEISKGLSSQYVDIMTDGKSLVVVPVPRREV
jgi:hypothetical protein